ncbi:MAG: hypothetical protein Q9190_003811, partial [Brigantiaea leucoxantha]
YVLKNQATDEVLFVVVFTLVPKEKVEEELASAESNALETEERKETVLQQKDGFEPQADDVD